VCPGLCYLLGTKYSRREENYVASTRTIRSNIEFRRSDKTSANDILILTRQGESQSSLAFNAPHLPAASVQFCQRRCCHFWFWKASRFILFPTRWRFPTASRFSRCRHLTNSLDCWYILSTHKHTHKISKSDYTFKAWTNLPAAISCSPPYVTFDQLPTRRLAALRQYCRQAPSLTALMKFIKPLTAVWETNNSEHHNSGHCWTAMKLQGKCLLTMILQGSAPKHPTRVRQLTQPRSM